jgi:hypothetical protein
MVEKHGETSEENMTSERDEIIRNAEAAYKRGELSAEDLLWLRIYTAKDLLLADELFKDEILVMPADDEQ